MTFSYRALRHQLQILTSARRLLFLGGGVGTGKTDAGTFWTLKKAAENPPGVLGLIAANSYSQLIDSTLRKLYRTCEAAGIRIEPASLPAAARAFTIRLHLHRQPTEILCRSLENAELLAGVELGWWWADEVWQSTHDAILLLQARLRDPRADQLQALLTTTLDEPGGWLHRMVVEQADPALMEVVYATTLDNARNLPDGYVEALQTTYSPRLYERMVLARWVSLEEGQIYHAFDPRRHLEAELELDPRLPVYWSHDFNIGAGKPMSSLIAQLRKAPGPVGRVRPELHVLDEIVMETADTQAVIGEFRERYPELRGESVCICGDASGHARDTRSGHTDYSLLAAAGFPHRRVPPANPPIRSRHNAVNACLRTADGDIRLRVHPRCRTLIRGLSTVRLRPGSSYQEEETREQHITTALGYLVCQLFPAHPPRVVSAAAPVHWK